MVSSGYPLECVAQLRDGKLEEAVRRLAAAAAAREVAESRRLAAERAGRRHEEATARIRSAEIEALERGALRAVDLRRAGEWASGAAMEGRRLQLEADQARADEARASVDEAQARAQVASRRAEVEVMVRHRALWNDARRRRADAREEEATFEAWRPGT